MSELSNHLSEAGSKPGDVVLQQSVADYLLSRVLRARENDDYESSRYAREIYEETISLIAGNRAESPLDSDTNRTLSFAELQGRERVTADEVTNCLADYASSGIAISSRAVNELLDRTEPTLVHLETIVSTARRGADRQEVLGHFIDAAQYARVQEHTELKLELLQQ